MTFSLWHDRRKVRKSEKTNRRGLTFITLDRPTTPATADSAETASMTVSTLIIAENAVKKAVS